ncbi:D-alanine--D-alanyl carrier protein ligase [Streptomyces microflavus]
MPHPVELANLVQWRSRRSARGSTTAQFAPARFDVAFQELFSTWAAGGTLVLVDNEVQRDPARLLALIRTAAVERLFLPYVALQQIAEYAAADDWHRPSMREVICAGEQLFVTPAIRDFFTHRTSASLENQYGPTETHVVTAERLSGDPSAWPDRPSIGHRARSSNPCPRRPAPAPSRSGGRDLHRGRKRRDRIPGTSRRDGAQRFVQDPHDPGTGRLYRSGDLGRFRPDGTIAFAGRRDGQVKIRGHRVECGEVEAVVKSDPGVTDAVVTVDATVVHDKRLIAHYTYPPAVPPPTRGNCAAPCGAGFQHLVPSCASRCPPCPDPQRQSGPRRPAHPAPRDQRSAAEAATPGLDATERRVAALWSELLGADRIGPDDDFSRSGRQFGPGRPTAVQDPRGVGGPAHPRIGVRRSDGRALGGSARRRRAAGHARSAAGRRTRPHDHTRGHRRTGHTRARTRTADRGDGLPGSLPAPPAAHRHPGHRALPGAGEWNRFGNEADTRGTRALYQLWDDTFTEHVVAVPGDLAQPQLGLSRTPSPA